MVLEFMLRRGVWMGNEGNIIKGFCGSIKDGEFLSYK